MLESHTVPVLLFYIEDIWIALYISCPHATLSMFLLEIDVNNRLESRTISNLQSLYKFMSKEYVCNGPDMKQQKKRG